MQGKLNTTRQTSKNAKVMQYMQALQSVQLFCLGGACNVKQAHKALQNKQCITNQQENKCHARKSKNYSITT